MKIGEFYVNENKGLIGFISDVVTPGIYKFDYIFAPEGEQKLFEISDKDPDWQLYRGIKSLKNQDLKETILLAEVARLNNIVRTFLNVETIGETKFISLI